MENSALMATEFVLASDAYGSCATSRACFTIVCGHRANVRFNVRFNVR